MIMSTWMMIAAVLFAPLIAVQVQKWLEHYRETRGRKMWVFQVLMATRNARLLPEHVRALNMIDLEFSGIRLFGKREPSLSEKKVLTAWKVYREHLNTPFDRISTEATGAWQRGVEDLFLKLLVAMGEALGYSYDAVDLKRGAYTPEAFGLLETEQWFFKNFLLEVAMGKRAIPMELREPEQV